MSLTRVLALVALIALAAASAAAQSEPPLPRAALDRATLATLSGTWASPRVESWYGAYGTREFRFERGQWSLNFVLAVDPEMKNKVFEFRTRGPYYIAQSSATVPGAFDAVFMEDVKAVTLRTRDRRLVEAFGLVSCNLEADVEKDISASGCASWKPVSQCREDHDLLALDGNAGLRFGVRPRDNDMCSPERRPRALLEAVVRR